MHEPARKSPEHSTASTPDAPTPDPSPSTSSPRRGTHRVHGPARHRHRWPLTPPGSTGWRPVAVFACGVVVTAAVVAACAVALLSFGWC